MELVKYLRDEVRSGFYIPTAIKQAWQAQLTILGEIDRICEKYNIRYFADWGTLLGVVRHGGYIPWDDDMDISMLREDYERFKKAAKVELPDGFAIQNFETKENHWLFLARVVNSNRICFDKGHLDKFCNFPYIATVDIFVLDYLYADEEKERQRCDEVKRLIAVADGIINGTYKDSTKANELDKIEKQYNYKIDRTLDSRNLGIQLYKLIELQMGRTSKEESDKIGQIFPWILKGRPGMPKEYYEKTVRLPFEHTTIPVPASYGKVVSRRYGDYFKVCKIWGGHGYPYFEGQKKNLQAVADFKLPEFTFDKNRLRENQAPIDKRNSMKSIIKECLSEIQKFVDDVADGGCENILDILADCQQLAVDLGTFIENVVGEERDCSKKCIAELEIFCETIYKLHEGINAGIDVADSKESYINQWALVGKAIEQQIINRREILIVATGADRWGGLDSIYNALVENDNNNVYVVALPMLYKDAYGQITMSDEEIISACEKDKYPEYVQLCDWDIYDISVHMPEEVYVQDPYDGENPCLTVPPAYYVQNMLMYTEKLTYVPGVWVGEFGAKDITDIYNMKHYVTAPGVVYADEILVQSENMKDRYVEKLTEFAGEETKSMWEEKIKVTKLPIVKWKEKRYEKKNHDKKCLLIGVGANCLEENKDALLAGLEEKLEIVKRNEDRLDIGVFLYPDHDTWYSLNEGLTTQIVSLIKKYESNAFSLLSKIENDIVKKYDAYYGSPMPLVHVFLNEKKPVMIMGVE